MVQRPTELHIELLPASVGRDLGGQAGQKATQRLSRVALQGEVVLELVYDPLDELALARRPATVGLGSGPLSVVLVGASDQGPVAGQPVPLHSK